MSFCRITGKSRGLPKPNYFPLLPPISPADAKRFCRITGKSYGLPSHHYIPVVMVRSVKKKRKQCHITTNSEGNEKHNFIPELGTDTSGRKRHAIIADYRYVFPILDESCEEQKSLTDILSKKLDDSSSNKRYVYTVDERRCSLVFSARLEAAVRDGDVRDVMLAKDSDTVLLKLRQGKNVTIDVKDVALDEVELWDGEGPSEEVIREREKEEINAKKKKRKRNDGLNFMKKIFEEKERAAEIEEEKLAAYEAKKAKVIEVKLSSQAEEEEEGKENKTPNKNEPELVPEVMEWKKFDEKHSRVDSANLVMCSGDWRDLVKPLIEDWDWDSFEREASDCVGNPVISALPPPVSLNAQVVDLSQSLPGLVQQQPAQVSEDIHPLQSVTAVVPLTPLMIEPDSDVQRAIKLLDEEQLCRTQDIKKVFLPSKDNEDRTNMLPNIEEIPEVMSKLDQGIKTEIEDKHGHRVHGLVLDIAAAQRFIAGQTVDTPKGPVFVPGQTVHTPSGTTFMPGLTVLTPQGPMLIPGQKVVVEENGVSTPIFVAGQTLATRDGEKFVAGQTLHTPEGPRFIPGQTVFTTEGPKFVAGQIIMEKPEDPSLPSTPRFIPGQTVMTSEGPQFVPGQTITTPIGESVFVPGQSLKTDNAWEFIPGQSVKTEEGEVKFVAGQTIVTEDGPKFVPGRMVSISEGEPPQFVPGITVEEKDGTLNFIPGKTVQTPEGPKFIEGQILKTATGNMFVPGKTSVAEDGVRVLQFAVAKNIEDVMVVDASIQGLAINPMTCSALPTQKSEAVFGHMVQTEYGVQFFPGTPTGLPAGKIVPGRLVHGDEGEVRFVPGIVVEEEDRFIPGQVVLTEKGEQFVPGQVVETSDGPKFVPGQVVETRMGPKFVPGQTIETPEGPRFVPGQIVETKAGPTFIPGQVISTVEEGSTFVPGQVVDTADGPRFVPGRVVETGDRVAFIPGQVVQTKEGLRFIAPDLQDTPEGGFEFSVQGFEVTPEELKLLRPSHIGAASFPASGGEMAIDSRMLRQLSDAGMAVGRQVPAEVPGVQVNAEDVLMSTVVVRELTDKLGLVGVPAVKMGDVLSTVVKLGSEVLEQQKILKTRLDVNKISEKIVEGMKNGGDVRNIEREDESIKEFVQTLVSAVVLTASQQNPGDNIREAVVASIGPVFDELLKDVFHLQADSKDQAVLALVESLHNYLVLPGNVNSIRENAAQMLKADPDKVNIVRSLLFEQEDEEQITDYFTAILRNSEGSNAREDIMGEAFKRLSQGNRELVSRVLEKVSAHVDDVVTDKDATETLQRAIVSVVRENSELQLQELMSEDADEGMKGLMLQAVGLARALGMYEAASILMEILSDPQSTLIIANDRVVLDILRRLTVMRQLAEQRPAFLGALTQLQSDPYLARSDPKLRELVRESAALMVVPEETLPLQSSADIPTALLHADNSLAMEDFLVTRHRRSGPLLILKQGLQAIIPREAARDVLTGQVAYTVLDENGISHFEPLHVFSALRLPRPAAHRFSMYCCPVASTEEEVTFTGTLTPTSSIEDLLDGMRRPSDTTTTTTTTTSMSKRYNTAESSRTWTRPWGSLASTDTLTTTSRKYLSANGDNTPSFRKYRGSLSSSFWGEDTPTRTPASEMSDVFVASEDYIADTADAISLKKGELVEILDTGDSAKLCPRAT